MQLEVSKGDGFPLPRVDCSNPRVAYLDWNPTTTPNKVVVVEPTRNRQYEQFSADSRSDRQCDRQERLAVFLCRRRWTLRCHQRFLRVPGPRSLRLVLQVRWASALALLTHFPTDHRTRNLNLCQLTSSCSASRFWAPPSHQHPAIPGRKTTQLLWKYNSTSVNLLLTSTHWRTFHLSHPRARQKPTGHDYCWKVRPNCLCCRQAQQNNSTLVAG